MKKPTPRKQHANRRNAKKSTGPKSDSGKCAVSRNAMVHGLRSLSPVLPGVEKVEDWEAHRAAVIARLAPVGAVEVAFAERIALGLWRLARCASAEGCILSAIQEKSRLAAIKIASSEDNLRKGMESAEAVWERLATECEAMTRLAGLWDLIESGHPDTPVRPNDVNSLIDSTVPAREWRILYDPFIKQFPFLPNQVAGLRSCMEWIAARVSNLPDQWLRIKATETREMARSARQRKERIRRAGEIGETLAMFQNQATEKLLRYETTIHRALLRDTHELQRLQAMRLGIPGTLPIAVDVTMDG